MNASCNGCGKDMPTEPREFRLTRKAEDDLKDIWDYTAINWSNQKAEHYHQTLVDCFFQICSGEKHGRTADHVRQGYRCLACESHFIFYMDRDDHILIVRILHQRMNIGMHL